MQIERIDWPRSEMPDAMRAPAYFRHMTARSDALASRGLPVEERVEFHGAAVDALADDGASPQRLTWFRWCRGVRTRTPHLAVPGAKQARS